VTWTSTLLYIAPGARDGLELDLDWASNLAWTSFCLAPKVVAKEEDVLGHLLGVPHLLGACAQTWA
jgi:hypothetical protein